MADNIFGNRIRQRREALAQGDKASFSLRKVAERAGVSPGYLSQVENGAKVPEEEVVRRLASVLGENERELLVLADHVPPDMEALLKQRPTLLDALYRLSEFSDDKVKAFVKRIDEGHGEW